MVESGDGPPPGNGRPENSTRVLAIAAAVAAVAAFAVAIGLMIGADGDQENAPASTTTTAPVASVTVPRTTVAVPPSEAGRFSAPNTSPLPTRPAHQVGEGCSDSGVPGRWDVVTGRGWVCVPTAAVPTPSAPTSSGGG